MPVNPTYKLEVEFAVGSYTDITGDCYRATVDRSAATLDQPLSAGVAAFLLDNDTGRYSPANSASPLYAFLDPGRRVLLTATGSQQADNRGFEIINLVRWSPNTHPNAWLGGTFVGSARSGSGYLYFDPGFLTGSADGNINNQNFFPISPGMPISAEGYVAKSGSPAGTAGIGIAFWDAGFTKIGSAVALSPASSLVGYTRHSIDTVVPSGTAYATFQFITTGVVSATALWFFDDASLLSRSYLFSGTIKRYAVQPVAGPKTVLIDCEDQIGRLLDTEVNLSLYANTNPGSLFTDILSQCNVSSFSVAAFTDAVPFAYYSTQKAASIFDQLVREGAYWINNDPGGTVNVRARNFNVLGTVVASYSEMFGLAYDISDESVVNVIRAEAQGRKQDTAISTIAWVDPDTLTIAAGATSTFWLSYVDPVTLDGPTPANSVVTPVSSLDFKTFTSTGGGGTQRTSTASVTATLFAANAKVAFTNNATEAIYVNKMQIRGYSLRLQPSVATVTEDNSSQALYRKHEQTYINETLTEAAYIAAYSQYLLGYRKDPRENVTLTIKNIFNDVIDNDLGDLVHVRDDNTGLNNRWTIIGVTHDINLENGIEHAATYKLERWNAEGTFILDTSQLNTGILGF